MSNNTRNLAARSPYLRKGGVHEVGKSAERRQHKRRITDALDEYQDYLVEREGSEKLPSFCLLKVQLMGMLRAMTA